MEPSDIPPDAGTIGGCCAIVLGLDILGLVCTVIVVAWLLALRLPQ